MQKMFTGEVMTNKPAWASLRPFKALESFQGVYVVPNTKDDFTLCMARNMEEANWIVAALNGEGQESVQDPQHDGASKYEENPPLYGATPSPCLEAAKEKALANFKEWNDVTGVFNEESSWHFEVQSVIEDAVNYGFEAARQEAAGRGAPVDEALERFKLVQRMEKAASEIIAALVYRLGGYVVLEATEPPEDWELVTDKDEVGRRRFRTGKMESKAVPQPSQAEELENWIIEEAKAITNKLSYPDRLESQEDSDAYNEALINDALYRAAGLKAEVDVKKCAEEICAEWVYVDPEYHDTADHEKDIKRVMAILNKHLNALKKPKSEKDLGMRLP